MNTDTATGEPEIVAQFPPGYRHRKYRWEKWLDGQIRRYVRGVPPAGHFDCDPSRFISAAQNWCDRNGYLFTCRRGPDDDVFASFTPDPSGKRATWAKSRAKVAVKAAK